MAREIAEQPLVWTSLLSRRDEIGRLAQSVRAKGPRTIFFLARGSSANATSYARYVIETRTGIPCGSIAPSTMTVYDATLDLRDVLVIAVSQSGQSPDLVEPLARARSSGALTLAITNTPSSPLSEAAELTFDLAAGTEKAVAATKTYSAELLALFLFAEALAGRRGAEAEALPVAAERVLEDETIARIATRYRFAEQLVTTARGYELATACETALKLMETTYVVAQAFSAADLLHGPMAMLDRGFPVIAIVARGRGGRAMRPVLEKLAARGADRLVVGDPEAASLGTVSLPITEDVAEVVAPILTILPLQRLAFHLARERGVNPDAPRGLSKITETR